MNRNEVPKIPQSSKASTQLKRQTDTQFDGDGQVRKKPRLATSFESSRTIRLSHTLTYRRFSFAEVKLREALAGHGVEDVPGYFFELFESFLSRARFDRVRAIASEHNPKLAQELEQRNTFSTINSWQTLADYKARETPLQVLYNWYHCLNLGKGHTNGMAHINMTNEHVQKIERRSKVLAAMAEHFGRGIVVLLAPLDFMR